MADLPTHHVDHHMKLQTATQRKPLAKPKPVTARWLLNIAQFYLMQRMATERQIADMLLRRAQRRSGEAADEAVRAMVADTVATLMKAGVLNDHAYADARAVTFKRKGLSEGAARIRLAAKGIRRELAGEAVAAAGYNEDEQIRTVARKLRIGPWARDGADLTDKDIARLARRGFRVASIRRALVDVQLP